MATLRIKKARVYICLVKLNSE